MPTSLGLNGFTVASVVGASGGGSGTVSEDTPFSDVLDGDGKLTLAVTDANLYSAEGFFQELPGGGASSGLRRLTPSNTTSIILESENQSVDAGKRVDGRYWLTPP